MIDDPLGDYGAVIAYATAARLRGTDALQREFQERGAVGQNFVGLSGAAISLLIQLEAEHCALREVEAGTWFQETAARIAAQ